jgi:hypothetical protein
LQQQVLKGAVRLIITEKRFSVSAKGGAFDKCQLHRSPRCLSSKQFAVRRDFTETRMSMRQWILHCKPSFQ